MDDAATAPYFDPCMCAWVFTRHTDVSHALHDPRLVVPGSGPAAGMGAHQTHPHDPLAAAQKAAAHRVVRNATRRTLTPHADLPWTQSLGDIAQTLLDRARSATDMSPKHRRQEGALAGPRSAAEIDLATAYAIPFGVHVAALATGVSLSLAFRCLPHAERLFLDAARNVSGTSTLAAVDAVTLAHMLEGEGAHAPGATMLDQAGRVQAFVALSQTLPRLLTGAWWELLRRPAILRSLCADDRLIPAAVEELLRLASPSHAVFREASVDVTFGECTVRTGERVALLLATANRDPTRFPDPGRLDLARGTPAHVALGGGMHHCAGAALVRVAMTAATQPLLCSDPMLELAPGVGAPSYWDGGFAIRGPGTLPVITGA